MKQLLAAVMISSILSPAAQAGIASLTCENEWGRSVFSGVIQTDAKLNSGRFENAVVLYRKALRAEGTAVVDRVTVQRRTGLVLPKCRGPYVRVYLTETDGVLSCATARIRDLPARNWNDRGLLKSLGLPESEIACAVTDARAAR